MIIPDRVFFSEEEYETSDRYPPYHVLEHYLEDRKIGPAYIMP